MPLTEFEAQHGHICRCLQQAKAAGRTGQAYLLVGDEADFLERFALAWAQTAACLGKAADGKACGQCQPCQMFARKHYPECFVIRPQSKSRQITVDAMRQFDHDMSLAAQPNRLKVGIVVEAECLGEEAQNAFLKTLEEPPRGTMLLLLTVNQRRLLPTIRSRCQIISLLRNQQDYSVAIQEGLFQQLARLHRRAGVKAGLQVAAAISQLFAKLHKLAEEEASHGETDEWDNVDNAQIKKQLAEEKMARVESEYVRLRNTMLDAMLAWFMQRFLIACGMAESLLPHPEIIGECRQLLDNPPTPMEAERDIVEVEDFVRCLKSYVEERMALDAMCLSIAAT